MNTDDWLNIAIAYNQPAATDDVELISESDVLDEAEAVRTALKALGHKVSLLPVSDAADALLRVRKVKPALIFNLCEGLGGDASQEMNVASLWSLSGIPYTGNGPLALGVAQDKPLAKRIFETHGIRTPRWMRCTSVPESCALRFPVIAKPACEDASLGISADAVATDLERLRMLVARLLGKYGSRGVLVEEFVDGREFNVALLGDEALPVSEIDFSGLDKDSAKITSYEAKWIEDNPLYLKTPSVCPAPIDTVLEAKLKEIALKVFHALGCKDYARVDMRCDSNGEIFVLECNPNPCISPDAGFVKALKAAGLSYKDFVAKLIDANLSLKAKEVSA